MTLYSKHKTGFSLVELSIVLVILGLLTGGILTGQSLIKAAELRAVTTELSEYQTAVMTFKQKYFALPGDMANATQFWGTDGNCAAVQSNSHTAALTSTCNGNGDGIVHYESSNRDYEMFLFWQHLQRAGLVTGQYSGVRSSAGASQHVFATNAPKSKFSNAGWGAYSYPIGNCAGTMYCIDSPNTFQIGTAPNDASTLRAAFTPEEAWNIDKKIDDAMPARGNMIARFWNNACTNSTANTDFAGTYRVQDNTVQCMLLFRNAM